MNKIFDKKDSLFLFIIIIIFSILFLLFFSNIYLPYSDIGREFYIPFQIINSKVLYKDILNVYAPLGYMINACILKIFNGSLNAFYFIGYILSVFSLIPIYLITKFYLDKVSSLFITISIIPVCVIFPSISNWITPYSYSVMYALMGILWAFYFLIKFLDDNKKYFLIISCLFYGFSISCKYEYSFFILLIFLVFLYKKCSSKDICKAVCGILFFPVLILLVLYIQGCSFSDFFNSFINIMKLSFSNSLKTFINYWHFPISLDSFFNGIVSFIFPSFITFFSFFGYISLIFLLIQSIKLFIGRKNISENELKIFSLILFSVLSSLKVLGNISLEIYGTYFLPIILISIYVFLHRPLFKEKKVVSVIISTAIFLFYLNYDLSKNNLENLHTEKGNIRINSVFYNSTVKLIEYIKNNIKKDEKVLILPEGTLINYITDNESDNILFYLIPTNVEMLTVKNINSIISKNKPDYIIISNIIYLDYLQKSFGTSWGKDIYTHIKNNYYKECVIGDNLEFYVYKLK